MASVIIMPKQGLMMEEGTITKWLVKEGEQTGEGTPLFEMETDKLTITMDSTATGTLLKILHPEGDVVPITMPIAIVGAPGEDISALTQDAAPVNAAAQETAAAPAAAVPAAPAAATRCPGQRVFSSPRARMRAEENAVEIADVPGSGPEGMVVERDVIFHLAARPSITPLAAKLAQAQGVDSRTLTGTGVGGKITVADLPGAAAAPQSCARGTHTEPMNGMRKAIARNMLLSKTTNAQTNHRISVDMTAAVALRAAYKEAGVKVSYNDIIVQVCARALMEMPIVNASLDGERIVYHDYANVGTAVSVPGGLIVPVIPDADLIGLRGIAEKSAELVEKAREGRLTETDYHGGTFTVSSLGMFDLDDFVAIINPPESAILAVGKIAKTAVVKTDGAGNDTLEIRPMCNLCLSYDHRIIDGAEAAKFLQKIKAYLQTPVLML